MFLLRDKGSPTGSLKDGYEMHLFLLVSPFIALALSQKWKKFILLKTPLPTNTGPKDPLMEMT